MGCRKVGLFHFETQAHVGLQPAVHDIGQQPGSDGGKMRAATGGCLISSKGIVEFHLVEIDDFRRALIPTSGRLIEKRIYGERRTRLRLQVVVGHPLAFFRTGNRKFCLGGFLRNRPCERSAAIAGSYPDLCRLKQESVRILPEKLHLIHR